TRRSDFAKSGSECSRWRRIAAAQIFQPKTPAIARSGVLFRPETESRLKRLPHGPTLSVNPRNRPRQQWEDALRPPKQAPDRTPGQGGAAWRDRPQENALGESQASPDRPMLHRSRKRLRYRARR